MIVEFSVKNFRSIKELQTISFVATGLKSSKEYAEIDENNIAEEGGMRLLKTVGIYGANASGKSNIIRAFEYFLQAIKNEASSESNLSALCDPFLYQENASDTESFFQIVLFVNGKKYRYGFTVKKNPEKPSNIGEKISKEIVVSEWLYGTKEKNMVELFTRTGMDVIKDKLTNGEKLPSLSFEHTLFLTHAAAFDIGGECFFLRDYINGWTISFSYDIKPFRKSISFLLEQVNQKAELIELLSSFNIKYNDIVIEKDFNKPEPDELQHDNIFMMKSFNNSKNKLINIKLNLSQNESSGTQKLFDLAGALMVAFDMHVSVLVIIDEIDSNFHPSLLIKLIGLFNNPKINKSNSQLLFTSHDTNLMSPAIMRRDQFYFTEKSEDDSTRLYSLADLKGIRNDADFAKQYLAGFYGALPISEDYSNDKIPQND